MSKKKENEVVEEVKYLTSLAIAIPVNDKVKHIQLTLVNVAGTDEVRCYMDVVDPSKIKLAKEEEK